MKKNLLDIELKGYDHYIFINERNKAQVVSKQGGWVTEHIRTAILKFNYEIDRIDKLLVKDFTDKELNESKKLFQRILGFFSLTSAITRLASNCIKSVQQ